MKAIVSKKGQITIPKELRERLGLKTGTVLQFDTRNGKLLAWKQVGEDVFEKWRGRGKLPAGKTVDEYLRIIRDDHRR